MGLPPTLEEEEGPELPGDAAAQLRDQLLPLLSKESSPAAEEFVKDACYWVARFCEFEPRFRSPSLRAIKKEWVDLDTKIKRLEATLRKLSPDTLGALDLDWWWNFDPLPEPDLPTSTDTIRIAAAAGLSPPVEGRSSSTYSVSQMLLELRRFQQAIADALEFERKMAATLNRKGGAPSNAAWSLLAWRLARAFEDRFGKLPSSSPDGNFELAFSECLATGLRILGTGKAVPDSLHNYVRSAVSSLKPSKKEHGS